MILVTGLPARQARLLSTLLATNMQLIFFPHIRVRTVVCGTAEPKLIFVKGLLEPHMQQPVNFALVIDQVTEICFGDLFLAALIWADQRLILSLTLEEQLQAF